MIDCVVSHHLNGFASGVARFNEILAERSGLPVLGIFDERALEFRRPLLSFKVSEMSAAERDLLDRLLSTAGWQWDAYLHNWEDSALEQRLVREAGRVLCGNREVETKVAGYSERVELAWTPGLLLDQRRFKSAALSVFSFGMAHKIQTAHFRRLRELLDQSGSAYAVYVSSAIHETSSISEAQSVYDEMNEIFPSGFYFMGNLSDVAVFNQIKRTTFFASFFPDGVRGNNTSVAAAMEHGSVVITNLDEHSPAHLKHMVNIIDLNRCDALPQDDLVLRRIAVAAMEAGRRFGWDSLVEMVSGSGGAVGHRDVPRQRLRG